MKEPRSTPMTQLSDEDHVRDLLTQHGLRASQEEVTDLAEAYRASRQRIKSLYTMEGVRYEQPALIFRAQN